MTIEDNQRDFENNTGGTVQSWGGAVCSGKGLLALKLSAPPNEAWDQGLGESQSVSGGMTEEGEHTGDAWLLLHHVTFRNLLASDGGLLCNIKTLQCQLPQTRVTSHQCL